MAKGVRQYGVKSTEIYFEYSHNFESAGILPKKSNYGIHIGINKRTIAAICVYNISFFDLNKYEP
jgi:hypothetical protein